MDATRYIVMSGMNVECVAPDAAAKLFGRKGQGVVSEYDVFA